VATGKDCSSCSLIFGGGSRRRKNRDELIWARQKDKLLISRLCRSMSIEISSSNKKLKD